MRRVMKWMGIVLGVLIALLVVVIAVFSVIGYQKLSNSQAYQVTESFTAPTSVEAVARGEYLVNSTAGCFGCHGDGGKGQSFSDGLPFGTLAAPNLTSGRGGIGGAMTDADWNRAIRHGIGHDGRVLLIMPSEHFSHMSDADLGAVVAYVKSLPPVDNLEPTRNLALPAYLFVGAGIFPTAAELIDHSAPHPALQTPAETADYGSYIVELAACRDCHGPNLAGQTGGANGAPAGPNLTPTGEVGAWAQEQFITTIRTGVNPAGRQLSDDMPWKVFKNMTDTDLGALYAYLHSLPAK
jgi:mono/diheme cytochrome c family protein